ncbi:hypothetical protein ZTR_11396 [Talaromyces verruculosus]|nr:hypothetical protein ZTR_11396 [Talaromyces verruculosus]
MKINMASSVSDMSFSTVTVIGAGPVGLYTALILAQGGVDVTVFESGDDVVQLPKAAGYFPVVLDEFKKTGLLFDVIKASIVNTGLAWRYPKQQALAQLSWPLDQISVHLGQNKLSAIILQHLAKYKVPVKFSHRLTDLRQTPDGVHAFIERHPDRLQIQHNSKYLVGADGGKSTVRKVIGIPFDGFSYNDFDIIASSIDYPLHNYCDWPTANFIVDPEVWGVVVQTGEDWRVTVGVRSNLRVKEEWDEEQAIKIVKERLSKILPGPTQQAKVKAVSPYTMHQRCASRFLDGRVILAGDAAHLTNPFGGLGLTTGLLDAALLGKVLRQVLVDGKSPSFLQSYAEKRRAVFQDWTSPTAVENLKRLANTDTDTIKNREEFFNRIRKRDLGIFMRLRTEELSLSSTRDD